MKHVTVEDVLSWDPCWDDARKEITRLFAGRHAINAIDVLGMVPGDITAEDAMWCVLREEMIDAPLLHELACQFAEQALALIDEPDLRSVAAIKAKRAWVRGEISGVELGFARDAARDAWDAAWGARNAAWGARNAAAWGARDAAWGAAWAAWVARDAWAARVAARDAASETQITTIRQLLTEQTP